MPRLALLALVLAAVNAARAETCPPAVALEGDSHAIGAVGEVLAARGISLVANCEAVHARLESRGTDIVIELVQLDGTRIERVVTDAPTAATVIESFVRIHIADPLLASRPVPVPVAPPPPIDIDAVRTRTSPRTPRGVRLSTTIETSFGSDHTRWMGLHLGACIMLGPICAGARVRGASVVRDEWDPSIERHGSELLAGIDIPFALRGWTFSPGFAAGLGHIETHVNTEVGKQRIESGGVRADVHATLSIPLWRGLALDLFTAADLTQETEPPDTMLVTHIALPDEPRLLVRFGIGLSYGGL